MATCFVCCGKSGDPPSDLFERGLGFSSGCSRYDSVGPYLFVGCSLSAPFRLITRRKLSFASLSHRQSLTSLNWDVLAPDPCDAFANPDALRSSHALFPKIKYQGLTGIRCLKASSDTAQPFKESSCSSNHLQYSSWRFVASRGAWTSSLTSFRTLRDDLFGLAKEVVGDRVRGAHASARMSKAA